MPKKIILVRHGQTTHNINKVLQGHLDTPLDETGKKQAIKAGQILRSEVIDVVFSSDLVRAYDTAKSAMQNKKNTKIHKTPLLRERFFGTFQGLTFNEIGQYISKFGEQGKFSFLGREKEFGIETEEELVQRIEEFKKILIKHRNKTVVVFSHGGLIRRMLKTFGIRSKNMDTIYIPNATPIVLLKKGSKYSFQGL